MRWWERVARWDETHRFAVDAWFAAILTFLTGIVTAGLGSWEGTSPEAAFAWSILLGLPLAWRRTRPVGSAVAVMGTALVHLMAGSPLILPGDLLVLVAIYSITVHGPRWAYRAALAGGLAGAALLGGYLVVVERGGLDGGILVTILTGLTVVSAFTVGLVRRARRETIQALVDRAERLEVERDQAARISTAAERTRIAREMHDIVAHSLSVVVAQADGGRYAAEQDPAALYGIPVEDILDDYTLFFHRGGGVFLREYRQVKGWNRQQLADHAKVSRTSIRCWESGQKTISQKCFCHLVENLGSNFPSMLRM